MKNVTSDRDSSVGRLLPAALEARAASAPAGACLDADTVAAWADRALTPDERAAAEAHAADCARCQTLLAAMVTTAPESPASSSRWHMPRPGWLIPLTAAAAAAIVWVAVPERQTLQQQSQPAAQIAEVNPPAASTSTDATTPARPLTRRNGSPAQENTDEPRQTPPTARDAKAMVDATALSGAATNMTSPPAAAEAPRAAVAPMKSGVRTFAATAMPEIVSSNPASRWRIVPGGAVQRSSDGGSTWQTQQTGATDTLAAGASPSPSVCWLVGPEGTVLLSTDDRSWRRLSFPEAAPLVAVSATDDQTATVTAADGRAFSTSDGGVTWSRSSLI